MAAADVRPKPKSPGQATFEAYLKAIETMRVSWRDLPPHLRVEWEKIAEAARAAGNPPTLKTAGQELFDRYIDELHRLQQVGDNEFTRWAGLGAAAREAWETIAAAAEAPKTAIKSPDPCDKYLADKFVGEMMCMGHSLTSVHCLIENVWSAKAAK